MHCYLLFFLMCTDCFTDDMGKCAAYSWAFRCLLQLHHSNSDKIEAAVDIPQYKQVHV